MKIKKINKKLELNKKTIADLGDEAMKEVNGGIGLSAPLTNCASCLVTGCKCPTGTAPGWCC